MGLGGQWKLYGGDSMIVFEIDLKNISQVKIWNRVQLKALCIQGKLCGVVGRIWDSRSNPNSVAH